MKCYLASPFFTSKQRDRVSKIREILLRISDVHSPMQDGVRVMKETNDKGRNMAYLSDIGAMIDADFCFAIMDYDDINSDDEPRQVYHGFDSGTIWEIGFCNGRGIPVFMYIPPNTKMNLMLTKCAKGYTTNINMIEKLIDSVLIKKEKFNESVFVEYRFDENKGAVYG